MTYTMPATRRRNELVGAIEMGSLYEVAAIIHRLRDLPEFGSCLHDAITRIDAMHAEVERLEREAAAGRERVRAAAESLVSQCVGAWTREEIFAATGYDTDKDGVYTT